MATLDVRNLTVSFPHFDPVRDLTFTVRAGETLALVGESGSGKSLTAMALMGLIPQPGRVTGGSILFGEHDLVTLPERDLRRIRGREIAMIFQEPITSLNPVLSIGRQIAETLRLHDGLSKRQARARVIELLDLVRIPDPARHADVYPHQISGGMRQRVMIAMAIACGPGLLIADEPTTALDVTIQSQVIDLLDRLRRELGMALILITHDLGLMAQWADRVVVMYAGRKIEEADPVALFDAPLHPYSRGLLAASPHRDRAIHYRDEALTEIPGTMASAVGQPGCPFMPRCTVSVEACGVALPSLRPIGDARLVACSLSA